MIRLPGNWKIDAITPQQTQQAGEFLRHLTQRIAAGVGVPAHLISHDVSQANYSSLRAALVSFRQRVERFRIEISDDGRTWETAAEGTTIGYKRIVRLPEARTARKLRVTIDRTRAPARISHVGLYLTE